MEAGNGGAGGRPTDFTQELGDLICALLAEGKSLREICALDTMPNKSTVLLWVVKGDRGEPQYLEFSDQYRRAREAQSESLMDEIIGIADDSSEDELFTEDGRRFMNSEFVQRSKLRVEARMKFAAQVHPKKWGEKKTYDVSMNASKLTDEQLLAAIRQRAGEAGIAIVDGTAGEAKV